ncbi:hypothetical protein E2562_016656 [Oryza meyeriana var. granulata]|uniref:Protein LURP-one-related 11 n=1 Tax=Oryza meyeriana var. granulata TaxID=110450 RepID=A0A6G1EM43_9ORYZ|nr:hypothetical protein E2562_016656 [Oryza meyeriana var. granulata]
MAKIQPLPAASPSLSSSSSSASAEWHRGGGLQGKQKKAVYTVWMKSLVFNGHGCTVYGSDGHVAFRVDNYGCRGSRDVFFMDTAGNTLIGIQTKRFGMLKRWEACRHHHGGDGFGETTTPWFRVQRGRTSGGGGGAMATVTLHGGGGGRAYRIDGCPRKSEYRITGAGGEVVAEMARKQTASGVVLGEDVLTLTVGPDADHLLVLGLVVVCGLMNRAM